MESNIDIIAWQNLISPNARFQILLTGIGRLSEMFSGFCSTILISGRQNRPTWSLEVHVDTKVTLLGLHLVLAHREERLGHD